ncbi:mannose-1-phosphate guanylyltransferase/mannose-6-phosphate isomerase [Xylella fastidiosa]|uniref:mannose-1-phosphate guanylyltransferase/mannose-6-phosphate isomerase n=1 Tax=Xylella fastidiosa TaxID=2371 RepID=UPI00249ED684|nr:mannose-1-phosphate guanylyltransferase/mannose-6-phosphate isomerase [Xylella fastidiosa]WGZ34547.1 mannose-1-phosphate guanylyltransferase/mannose-6-phosphate isomerase [Xylella fastidiosa subsp. pauca]WGZ36832.1 mannose-1-phosphate guanylyltransferase/mannose-6-phosphate isomerase [Xylella fastidiosa subsp. pauca]
MNDILPVILSGGSGTRLWPLSREAYPKQFLPLLGHHSMLQATWLRAAPVTTHSPIVVANEEHRFIAAEQLQHLGVYPSAILLEPKGRNTAPAIAVAALEATRTGNDPLLLVLPSDHVIRDETAFQTTVHVAAEAAAQGKLVTFGITPNTPEIGYGYIKATGNDTIRPVERFIEKPDLATAQSYLASGDYFWNSGMFLFRASRYLAELSTFQPAIAKACQRAWSAAKRDTDFIRLDKEAFESSPADSIDYAVMEHTADAVAVPLDAGWNDVGSWSALHEVSKQDNDGNAHQGDVIQIDCRNTYAYGSRLIAMIGLENVVVVETDDALLVGHRDSIQTVKEIVGKIKANGRPEATWHRKVYRPWGAYDSIDTGQRFQVKRITVKPGGTLSLQMHHHRAEHWIIVSGTAEVTRGSEILLLTENQSTYIPLGVTHRLRNPGKLPLELIEVQSGSYLGEDDIVRFEDTYGRT